MAKPQKAKAPRPTRREKSEIKGRMKNFMMFLPNMVKLLGKLLADSRVPLAEKALFAGAVFYVIMPLDFIPDILPFIGQVDDIYLVALTLLRLINRTDETVVRENWSGGGDIVALADSIAGIAPAILPKRVSRVLSANVELAAGEKIIRSLKGDKKEPIVYEIPSPEIDKQLK